jgi:hypothetical protein
MVVDPGVDYQGPLPSPILTVQALEELEAGAQKRLMVDSTGNLKLISYLFPFQENACMPCSALGREAS